MKNANIIDEYLRDMNHGGRAANVIAYDGETFENGTYNLILRFKPDADQRIRYNILLRVAADNDILIIETHPGTLETTVRIDK